MPTIEVEDNDVVFVVKGRGDQRGGYHVLGPRDLLVMVQVIPEVAVIGPQREICTRIFVGGNLVSGLARFKFEVNSANELPRVEVMYQGAWDNYRHVDELLSRLEPYITVLRSPLGGVDLVQSPDRYIGVRVSRYQREPVI